jgi:hypothetical protein
MHDKGNDKEILLQPVLVYAWDMEASVKLATKAAEKEIESIRLIVKISNEVKFNLIIGSYLQVHIMISKNKS